MQFQTGTKHGIAGISGVGRDGGAAPGARVVGLGAGMPGYHSEHDTAAGVQPDGPAMAYFDTRPGASYDARPGRRRRALRETVTVHAAFPVSAEPGTADDFAIAELPGAGRAATIIHYRPMDEVGTSFEALARWIDANGYTSTGLVREVYRDSPADAPEQWVTELQVPVLKESERPSPEA